MQTPFLEERSRLPALHARCENGDVIHAAGLHGRVSADLLEARPAKDLACARDVLDADEPVVVRESILKWRSDESEAIVLRQFSEEEFEMVGLE